MNIIWARHLKFLLIVTLSKQTFKKEYPATYTAKHEIYALTFETKISPHQPALIQGESKKSVICGAWCKSVTFLCNSSV